MKRTSQGNFRGDGFGSGYINCISEGEGFDAVGYGYGDGDGYGFGYSVGNGNGNGTPQYTYEDSEAV